MRHHTIIYMHPTYDSFNGRLLEAYRKELEQNGFIVTVRAVYDLSMKLTLTDEEYQQSLRGRYPEDVQAEHTFLAHAEAVTLIFPVWWGTFPAAGKGYLDRVLSYGFAYELEGESPIGHLNHLRAHAIYTTGSPKEEANDMQAALESVLNDSIFSFCGMNPGGNLHFGNVVQAGQAEHEQMIREVEAFARAQADT
ncbi:NAD(P)H dehydrogenase (quinone) [Salsuginibacillus halophilus]|uniref:NAD(P)H dehydrogenase (Quinone) n=1 Tax=Salsuginibacillus halophilus TaxID=517424 RepID=A0A2P8HXK3_9BACI|nr:NAD(P)H-dependent oxidoreductase [Salsuginibacillus halophilus]PSL50963.1 NAD(P)H dehydrogenase (quinone) [Salsuginibacillus halophilus]